MILEQLAVVLIIQGLYEGLLLLCPTFTIPYYIAQWNSEINMFGFLRVCRGKVNPFWIQNKKERSDLHMLVDSDATNKF